MKEKFKELYHYIIHSSDEDKMHVLGHVTKDMMCNLIDNYPLQAKEYLDILESVKWCNYVTAKEADHIIEGMVPQPTWTRVAWSNIMSLLDLNMKEEPCYNEHALYVTMCMISSDSEETIIKNLKDIGVEPEKEFIFKFIYRLALDKLKDKDKMFNIRNYFKL